MKAMVLAAGLGTRMRPLTEHTPKPLIEVAGKALIDWSLDALVEAGYHEIVVNVSYLAEQIEAHIAKRGDAKYTLSPEAMPLETGGGIKRALPHLGEAPFVVMNADAFCLNGAAALAQFDETERAAPIQLLLQPRDGAVGYHGKGDFFCEEGTVTRRGIAESAPYVFTGIQRLCPTIFAQSPDGAFSMNVLYDKALAMQDATAIEGVMHKGTWLHVGTPDEKKEAEAFLAQA